MKLAELILEMSANTAHLHSDLENASRKVQQFADGVKTALAGLGVGLSFTGLAEAIKQVADYGAEVAHAAERTGMTTEQVSRLSFAAKASGIEFQSLQQSITIFDKNVAGLSNTNSRAAKALDALGISTKNADGSIRPVHDLLLSVAGRFEGMRDGAEKTAIAVALFGRSGAALIPFLNEGAEGIRKLEAQADSLGLVMGKSAAEAAVQFNASLATLKGGLQGLEIEIGTALLPRITDLIVGLIALKEEGTAGWGQFGKDLAVTATTTIGAIPMTMLDWARGDDMATSALARWANQAYTSGDAAQALYKKITDLRKAFDYFGKEGTTVPTIPGAGGGSHGRKESQPLVVNMPDEEDAKVSDGLESYYKHLQDVVRGLFAAQEPLQKYLVLSDDLNGALKIGMITLDEYNKLMGQVWKPITQAPLAELPIGGRVSQAQINQMIPSITVLNDKFKGLRDNARQFGVQASEAFSEMIVSGRSFQSSLESLIQLFAQFILKAYAFKAIESLFGLSSSASTAGLSVAGGRAGGGGVSAGELYMVGESGPELFAPGASGSIIPNSSLRGGNTYIDARGAQPGVEHQIMRAVKAMQKQQAGQALVNAYEYKARGGNL